MLQTHEPEYQNTQIKKKIQQRGHLFQFSKSSLERSKVILQIHKNSWGLNSRGILCYIVALTHEFTFSTETNIIFNNCNYVLNDVCFVLFFKIYI